MKSKQWISVGAGCLCASGIAYAGQTVNYTYDALGRLVQAQVQSGPGAGTTEGYSYDAAGNRKQYQVSGAPGQTPVTLSMGNTIVNETSTGATITVNVGSSSASGTLTLTENGVLLGSTWVANGQASVILQGLTKGKQTVTATYSGDDTYAAQTTTFTINVEDLSWLPAVLNLLLQ